MTCSRYGRMAAVVAGLLLLAGCASSGGTKTTTSTSAGTRTAPPPPPHVALGTVNEMCPISGRPITVDAPTATYKGRKIGFCCGNCPGAWDGMSQDDKDKAISPYAP